MQLQEENGVREMETEDETGIAMSLEAEFFGGEVGANVEFFGGGEGLTRRGLRMGFGDGMWNARPRRSWGQWGKIVNGGGMRKSGCVGGWLVAMEMPWGGG